MLKFLRTLLRERAGSVDSAEVVEHKGYIIRPTPKKEAAGWRVECIITKEVDGETRSHHLIRADTFMTREDAISVTVFKAQRIIAEQGERMFET